VGTCLLNLQSVCLTVLEQLAFNAEKYRGHVTTQVATPSFRKILRGYVRTVPGNMQVNFEVRTFNRVGKFTPFPFPICAQIRRHTKVKTSYPPVFTPLTWRI